MRVLVTMIVMAALVLGGCRKDAPAPSVAGRSSAVSAVKGQIEGAPALTNEVCARKALGLTEEGAKVIHYQEAKPVLPESLTTIVQSSQAQREGDARYDVQIDPEAADVAYYHGCNEKGEDCLSGLIHGSELSDLRFTQRVGAIDIHSCVWSDRDNSKEKSQYTFSYALFEGHSRELRCGPPVKVNLPPVSDEAASDSEIVTALIEYQRLKSLFDRLIYTTQDLVLEYLKSKGSFQLASGEGLPSDDALKDFVNARENVLLIATSTAYDQAKSISKEVQSQASACKQELRLAEVEKKDIMKGVGATLIALGSVGMTFFVIQFAATKYLKSISTTSIDAIEKLIANHKTEITSTLTRGLSSIPEASHLRQMADGFDEVRRLAATTDVKNVGAKFEGLKRVFVAHVQAKVTEQLQTKAGPVLRQVVNDPMLADVLQMVGPDAKKFIQEGGGILAPESGQRMPKLEDFRADLDGDGSDLGTRTMSRSSSSGDTMSRSSSSGDTTATTPAKLSDHPLVERAASVDRARLAQRIETFDFDKGISTMRDIATKKVDALSSPKAGLAGAAGTIVAGALVTAYALSEDSVSGDEKLKALLEKIRTYEVIIDKLRSSMLTLSMRFGFEPPGDLPSEKKQ